MTGFGQAISFGYQGSETSRCEVIVYTRNAEPFLKQFPAGATSLDGRDHRDEGRPSLIEVSTSKTLGGPAGSFRIVLKAENTAEFSLMDSIAANDWIDIVFTRHARRYHTMRGLVDDISSSTIVNSDGVTSRAVTIHGRDFQKIFEETPIWFDVLLADSPNAALSRLFSEGAGFFQGTVPQTVERLIRGFLDEVSGSTQAVWELPPNLPNTFTGIFAQSLDFYVADFSDIPERRSPLNPVRYAGNNPFLWQLAQAYSDPALTELYTDLAVDGEEPYFQDGQETTVNDTRMTVFIRDRPFPTVSRPGEDVLNGPWFNTIPTYIVPRQHTIAVNTVRSDRERKNAFFVSPLLAQDLSRGHLNLLRPLVDVDDVRRHGFRRYDITTNYFSRETDTSAALLNMTTSYRNIVRDFHCLNPLLSSGNIRLGLGRPDIHVGGRLQIPGDTPDLNETYYVEAVSHNWNYRSGIKTDLSVTRGFEGSDITLANRLQEVVDRYRDDLL